MGESTDTGYAFKCRNCGHLERDGNQGEREVPAACTSCGAGVAFDPRTGIKTYETDNWIVLKDLSADEFKEIAEFHGITDKDIVAPVTVPATE